MSLVVPLPAERFVSRDDYLAARDHAASAWALRARVEARCLATDGGGARAGTCAPCLRPTTFLVPRAAPDWAGALRCDCEDRLGAADRWALHAALGPGRLGAATRLRLAGPVLPLHRRLRALAAPEEASRADLIVALDAIREAAEAVPLLARLRATAAAGAVLLARLPFAPDGGRPRALGWEVLDYARAAGWEDAGMLRGWSREFGYLGPDLFLLLAHAG